MQLVQRVQMMSLTHHIFFCTLTYNNESMPRLTTSSGFDFRYCDVHDLQCMIKRLRKYNSFTRPFKYFAVSERGSQFNRPHFHILFFLDKYEDDNFLSVLNLEPIVYKSVLQNWVRNYGSTRKPIYRPLLTLIKRKEGNKVRSTYDCHYVSSLNGSDSCTSVAFYCLKYMLKPSTNEDHLQQALRLNLPEDEYRDTWRVVRSRYFYSKQFGDPFNPIVSDYIKECVRRSKLVPDSKFPMFYNVDDGKTFPLARYYKNKVGLFTFDDALHWYNPYKKTLDTIVDDDLTPLERVTMSDKKISDLEKIQDIALKATFVDLNDDLFK